MYIWGDVCLSLYFYNSVQLSFFFSFSSNPNLLPLHFSLSCPLSWYSLTLIVVVLVPFFKPSKSVSYQTPSYKMADPGTLASQHNSASGAYQAPQANCSQIGTLMASVFWTARYEFHPRLSSLTFSMWRAARSRPHGSESKSQIFFLNIPKSGQISSYSWTAGKNCSCQTLVCPLLKWEPKTK